MLWTLLLLAIIIAILAFIASQFYYVAQEKGYDEPKYFWIPFLFSLVGYLLVIALPDRSKPQNSPIISTPTVDNSSYTNSDVINKFVSQAGGCSTSENSKQNPSNNEWKCVCGRVNPKFNSRCSCGRSKYDV